MPPSPLHCCPSFPPRCSLVPLSLVSYSPIRSSHSRKVILTHHKAGQMAHQKLFRCTSPFIYRSQTSWHTRPYLVLYKFLQPRSLPSASLFIPLQHKPPVVTHTAHTHTCTHTIRHTRVHVHVCTRSVLHSLCSLCLKHPPRFPHLPQPAPHLHTPTSPHVAWLAAKRSQHLRPQCPCFLGSFPEATSGIRPSVSI